MILRGCFKRWCLEDLSCFESELDQDDMNEGWNNLVLGAESEKPQ